MSSSSTRRQLLQRTGAAAVVGVVGPTLLSACGPSAPPSTATAAPSAPPSQAPAPAGPKAIDRVRIATAVSIPHFNMLDGSIGSPGGFVVGAHVFDNLWAINPLTNKFEAQLVEASEFSADGLTLRAKIRKGVKFHDGTDLTAEDVKFTYERKLDKTNTGVATAALTAWVKSVAIVDPYTVEFKVSVPQRNFFEGRFNDSTTAIFPQAYYQKVGDKGFQEKPIGSGPYRVVDFQVNTRMTLETFPDYWGPKPLTKTLDVRFVPDEAARVNLLRAGDVDFIDQVGIESARTLRDHFDVYTQPGGASVSVRLTTKEFATSPWADVRVRQAMNCAVDKKTINQQIYDGACDVMPAILTRASADFNSGLQPYAFDQAKAKALLAEAGHAKGFQADLFYPQGRYLQATELMTSVAGYLKQVGIEVTLRPLDTATWSQRLNRRGRADPVGLVLGGPFWNWDALTTLQQVLVSTAPPVGTVDADIDKLLVETIPALSDPAQRRSEIQRAERIVYDKAYYLFLMELPNVWVSRKNIHWTASPAYWYWSGWLTQIFQ